MQYRADIDGLRTIAVLVVVLFHLDVAGFTGGFVGVDVFFVISGFLITSIIAGKIGRGSFRLGEFYARRIQRLFPPLIATVVVTFAAASFVIAPYDFIAFARSAVASLFSVSNFVFFAEAGYWDTASELKPLLHTWSLGVEEQFYLLWPALLLWYLGKPRRFGLGGLLLAVFLVGYPACIWWTVRDPSAAFYLLPFRAFEFAMGAGVICIARWRATARLLQLPGVADGAALAGIALIAWSVYQFDGATRFPGWPVIIPTAGSVLLLLSGAGPRGSGPLGRWLLCNPASLWLGRVSYSMYLVHWPIVALYRYRAEGESLEPAAQVLLGALTLVATALLHYGVERRFYRRGLGEGAARGAGDRTGKGAAKRTAEGAGARPALAILAVSGLLAIAPLSAWWGDGWSWRWPGQVLTAQQVEQGMRDRFQLTRRACSVNRWGWHKHCAEEKPLQVLVFGNSHEPDAYNFLHTSYGNAADINLVTFGSTNNCPNLEGRDGQYTSTNDACRERFEALFQEGLPESLDVIVYATERPFIPSRQIHLDVIRDLMARNSRVKLVTVSGYLVTNEPCWRLLNRDGGSGACSEPGHVVYFESDPSRWALYEAFMAITDLYLDRVGLLCRDRRLENCLTETPDGVPMFYDEHHLSFEFSSYAGRLYEASHPEFLRQLVAGNE